MIKGVKVVQASKTGILIDCGLCAFCGFTLWVDPVTDGAIDFFFLEILTLSVIMSFQNFEKRESCAPSVTGSDLLCGK